jgi:hypothetical protein
LEIGRLGEFESARTRPVREPFSLVAERSAAVAAKGS